MFSECAFISSWPVTMILNNNDDYDYAMNANDDYDYDYDDIEQ